MTEGHVSPGQYIGHHLEHLSLNLKTFSLGEGGGFWTLNLDTFIVSVVIGVLLLVTLRLAATRMTEVPGKLQNLAEMLIEYVDTTVHEIVHHKTTFIPSLALTIFIWIFAMNAM